VIHHAGQRFGGRRRIVPGEIEGDDAVALPVVPVAVIGKAQTEIERQVRPDLPAVLRKAFVLVEPDVVERVLRLLLVVLDPPEEDIGKRVAGAADTLR
jgi:hypothetical protein